MKKSSILVGVTLLFASLFTTSCKEIMSNLDEPVSSYLTVNDADIVVPTGDTYQIEAASINSDKVITYKSSDEKVATVDANGLVTGIADGEATITVAVEASENYNAGEQKIQVAVKRPLTFEALEDGSISISFSGAVLEKPIVYKKNKENKVEITSDTNIPVEKGDKIEFESTNERLTQYDNNWGLNIYPNSKCAVYGNVMSMISPDGNYHTQKAITKPYALFGMLNGVYIWDDAAQKNVFYTVAHDKYKLLLPATTLTEGCYYSLLANTGFTEAPELPAKELAPSCYRYMFNNCQDLTEAPALPANELKDKCYYAMFQNCHKLENAPALPATKLADYCYAQMFQNCYKLEKAPALPATEMKKYCYAVMFSNTALTKAPELKATKLADYCYYAMFNASRLEKAPALPVTKLAVGCYKQMFANSYGLGGSIVLPAEELPAECYREMFSWCRKLEKVECLATSMTGNNALTNWLNGAGTELETNPVFVRAEANNKWKNKDGWAVSQTPNDWYIPTNWTIEPPITVENIRVKTYTDGAFPYWSTNGCVTSVINGAAHYVPNGNWNSFVCLQATENPLAAGDYVFIFDIESNKDLNAYEVSLDIRNGWDSNANVVSANVPIKAGRHTYRVGLPGVTGGNYDCYFNPGNADATLDLYSVSVNKVVE